jgi:hypothetical protein
LDEGRTDEKMAVCARNKNMQNGSFSEMHISDQLDVSLGTISNVFKNGKLSEIDILQLYNVWSA